MASCKQGYRLEWIESADCNENGECYFGCYLDEEGRHDPSKCLDKTCFAKKDEANCKDQYVFEFTENNCDEHDACDYLCKSPDYMVCWLKTDGMGYSEFMYYE